MSEQMNALYEKSIEVRWADCDANQHMRHSAYADLCTHARIGLLDLNGINAQYLEQQGLCIVLFKEQTEYFLETFMGDVLRITVEAGEASVSRKSFNVIARMYLASGALAAQNQVVVGFMDVKLRKIVPVPKIMRQIFNNELSRSMPTAVFAAHHGGINANSHSLV